MNNAKLLPVDERILEIPRQVKGGMGQSNEWYADKPEGVPIVKKVLQLVGGKRVKAEGINKGKKENKTKNAKPK